MIGAYSHIGIQLRSANKYLGPQDISAIRSKKSIRILGISL